MAQFKILSGYLPGGTGKPSQDIQSLGLDLNPGPPDYKVGVQSLIHDIRCFTFVQGNSE
jgi:hypothetical protein